MDHLPAIPSNPLAERDRPACRSDWSARYGERHRLVRIERWPAGIDPPRKIRLYWRAGHFVLQWWDPAARRNLSERVDGDLIAAIARARELDQRLLDFGDSGRMGRRLRHAELVAKFLEDLSRRAEAGQIDPRSVRRYRAALSHYLAFTEQATIAGKFPYAVGANREFSLAFAAFLRNRRVAANGLPAAPRHAMKARGFVWDAVRAAFHWAVDPDRGHLLPEGFRNPFRHRQGERTRPLIDPFGEPDITVPMAADFLRACDEFQLRLFVPIIFYGLRAAEPAYLFHEYLQDDWLVVPCNPDLAYATKGRRDKRLPLFEPMAPILRGIGVQQGLLYTRRKVSEGRERPPLLGSSLQTLTAALERRAETQLTPASLRDQVLREAGGITYDHIQHEFESLARTLHWPAPATLKDFRHLFASSLANAGMPEPYRQYLMGHAVSSAVIGIYTHLNKIRDHYLAALEREWPALIEVVRHRSVGRDGNANPGH